MPICCRNFKLESRRNLEEHWCRLWPAGDPRTWWGPNIEIGLATTVSSGLI
jgi:hypothetical protein